MKFFYDHIEWGKYTNAVTGKTEYAYWFYFWPNWLPKDIRYFGYHLDWYDHPIASFGFWYFNLSWYTKWTKAPKEMR